MLPKYFKMQQVTDPATPPASGSAPPTDPPATPAATPAEPTKPDVWTDAITEQETKDWVISKGYKDISALSRSAHHLEKLSGVPPELIVKLPTGDNPDAWRDVHVKLGMPKTAEEYVIDIPEGNTDEFATTAKGWFHKAGLSQTQAKKVVEDWNSYQKGIIETQKKTYHETVAADMVSLKQEWGGEYDTKSKIMEKAAKDFGMTDKQLIDLKVIMGPANASKFLYNIGLAIPDPTNTWVDGEKPNSFQTMTKEQARAQIAANQKSDLFSSRFAGKAGKQEMEAARAESDRLGRIAFPDMTTI